MDEEMGVHNEGESRGMVVPDTLESGIPGKPPALNVHRLRNLAIASIICGCSCIGVLALIYAVKANEKQKAHSQNAAYHWARKSRLMSCLTRLPPVSVRLATGRCSRRSGRIPLVALVTPRSIEGARTNQIEGAGPGSRRLSLGGGVIQSIEAEAPPGEDLGAPFRAGSAGVDYVTGFPPQRREKEEVLRWLHA
ncbi:putative transmembrane protein [Crotalus adamanteus]|uniref:Transmembrane protein n=1 Tax=Crotalus adamanteus TaxID=8729 RepID=A0AAW1B6B2_CROAD